MFSWLIVAFGQSAWIPVFSVVAAAAGYAIFWKESLKIETRSRRFWTAVGWFALVQAIQLSWMTAVEFQGIYILAVYAALCFALGLQFGLLTLLVDRLPHVAVASLWTLFEWARLFVLCGFSWNPVGLALASFAPSMQFAALFGVFGLSFWVILTNLALLHRKKKAWLALAFFPYLFGAAHLYYHGRGMEESPKLSVGLVQTGLRPPEKIPMEGYDGQFVSPYDQWGRIFHFLKMEKQRFDLIVLPEHAVAFSAETPAYDSGIVSHILGREVKERVTNLFWGQSLAHLFSADVVAGFDATEGTKHYAAAFHFAPQKEGWGRYDKQILVPLGEYLPFEWLKRFTEKYGIIEFFTHGKGARVFQGKVPFSVSICYEETFPHLIREGRTKGAELFVNVTNDNWYPHSKLPLQHFAHGRLRAIENGVPLVRACNTAVTAAVDSLGRTLASIEQEEKKGALAVQIPTYHYRTLYTLWGDFGIVGLSFGLLLTCFLLSKIRRSSTFSSQ